MHRLHKAALALIAIAGIACIAVLGSQYFGIGHRPQYPEARVAWWQSPGRVGGTIDLNVPESPIAILNVEREQCRFENGQNRIVSTWRFLRNSGHVDVYRFRINVNDQGPVTRTVAIDGEHASVLRDSQSGTALTIEGTDPFRR